MKEFKRKRTRFEELQDRWINSFQKTGFINDHLIKTTDRDFWKQFQRQIITDANVASIFESILVGYQKIPYSESVIQKIMLQAHKDEEIYKRTGPVFARTQIFHADIYRCIFVYSPINFASTVKGVQIRNTLRKLREEYKDFTLIPHVVEFLEEQYKLHKFEAEKLDDIESDLFLKEPVTILTPELVDGAYYNINDLRRYPVITEAFHYNRSHLGQIKFIFRIKYQKKKYMKYVAYFHAGHYTTNDNGVETPENKIFYAKFFSRFYNPFLIFDKHEIDGLMKDLLRYPLSDEVLQILNNTYNMYIDNIDAVRENYGNGVPSIPISKPNDNYYDREMTDELDELLNDSEESEDDEEVVDGEDHPKKKKASEDDDNVPEPTQAKTFKVSRQVLSLDKLKSLILGYNEIKYYGFYSHLNDNLLGITDINKSGYSANDSSMVSSKQAPKSMQITKTIASNPMSFMTNTEANYFDIFHLFDYRKDLPMTVDTGGGKDSKTQMSTSDRFQTFGTNGEGDYGVIDPVTLKSENTSGTAGSVSMLKFYEDSFVYSSDEEYEY